MMAASKYSEPLDLSHHFSDVTKNREASDVKRLYKFFTTPGVHNLAAGWPHMSVFPFDTLEASTAHPERFEPTQYTASPESRVRTHSKKPAPATHLTVPKESRNTDPFAKIDLATALQYGTAEGFAPLKSFVRQFVRDHLHPNVPYANGPEVILTCGSTDGFGKAVEALSTPWIEHKNMISEREGILCEEFAYMNAIQAVRPRGLNIVPVGTDSFGMKPWGADGLADILENWDFRRGKRPHLMYTVTLGQNPTGSIIPPSRRKALYELCHTYDIIIIEDEPYWNLQYPSAIEKVARCNAVDEQIGFSHNYNAHGRSSGFQFLDSLIPSYLSIDEDGRVVRLDTFSKTIAPGCRLGWLTAQPKIVERIARITESTTQTASGFVQVMVAALINGQQEDLTTSGENGIDAKGWQLSGWVRWLEGLRGTYERRMQAMCKTFDEGKHIILDSKAADADSWSMVDKVPMYEFEWPMAGMFIWVKVRCDTHPLVGRYGPQKVCAALWVFLTQKPFLCLTGPGSMFAPTEAVRGYAFQYLRFCFAPMPEDEVADYARSFTAGCRAFWQLSDFDDIPDLDAHAIANLRLPSC